MDVKKLWLAIGTVALVAVLVVGLVQAGGRGGGEPEGAVPAQSEVDRRLAGAPEPLARVHRQGSEILPGGPQAFRDRLAALDGYPVVVNKWAAWCAPCKAEFPEFQNAALRYGKRVAFLGVNSMDNRGEAKSFLEDYPVPYPSYEDRNGTIAQLFQGAAFPSTAFYDRSGKLAFLHQGQYLTGEQLEEDIERYALR
jgi:cytochrome c biogenesis protein CcmG/thiol:disulfide interchange protein DsbE